VARGESRKAQDQELGYLIAAGCCFLCGVMIVVLLLSVAWLVR
jgi:hypothetical protein